MADLRLHADHIDTTGAYVKRFEVVKELVENGTLTEIPEEFKVSGKPEVQPTNQIVEVQTSDEEFVFFNQDGERHADHMDTTGRYRIAWQKRFGEVLGNGAQETPQQLEWKQFLTQLIAEEKSKLDI